jgi:nicotinamidase-related amidase
MTQGMRSVRHKSRVALLLVDVINHFEFPSGQEILQRALRNVPPLARFKKRARAAGVPTIYVNDNFGQWRSETKRLLQYCLRPEAPGLNFVEQLQPDDEGYFVLKPMHSAFYQTPLDLLLWELGASSIILSGLATNNCILCTAHDANMRHFEVIVPRDCCAARTAREYSQALEHIASMADAKVVTSPSSRRLGAMHG